MRRSVQNAPERGPFRAGGMNTAYQKLNGRYNKFLLNGPLWAAETVAGFM
jgi:hypothetical protein